MYSLLKEIDFLNSNSSAGGGGALVAFNYPLVEEKEKEFAKAFLKTAMESKDNLYYYPKPNHYTEVDDFAFFSLQKNITSENLKIESLYRQGQIRRDLRGQLHTLLRKSKNIEDKFIYKKFFYESRKLFNCSWDWKEYKASQEQLEYDLLEKIGEFYAYPIMANISTINICNLECEMCPLFSPKYRKTQQNDLFSKKELLDTDKVYAAIAFLGKNAKLTNIGLSFIPYGEPLLDNRMVDFIAFARQNNIALISTTTNGLLLEEKGEKLLEAGLNRMTISIDGATPETYRRIEEQT